MTTKTKKRMNNPPLITLRFRKGSGSHYWWTQAPVEPDAEDIPPITKAEVDLCHGGVRALVELPTSMRYLHVTLYKHKPTRGAVFGLHWPWKSLKSRNGYYEYEPVRVIGDRTEILFSGNTETWLMQEIFKKHNITRCYARVEWS